MEMRFGWLVLVVLFCFGTSDVLGYPRGCSGNAGFCTAVNRSGGHICPDCGRHVVPGGISHKMVPASQCWRPECVAARQSSGSSSDNGGSTYDPYEAQRLAAEAEAERLRQEALREAARKKKLRKDAAKARKTWDKNDAETMRQMESMFASSSKKKIPKLKCDCNNGWRDCEWCENGTRDCTRYGCRGGTENCGCVRPGVGPKPGCADCKGSGLIKCRPCEGKGTMPCNWCENGKVRCWACGYDFQSPIEQKPFEPIPDPLAEAREQALDKMIHVDASLLSVDQKQSLAAARAAYLKSIASPLTSSAMQSAERAVFNRDRELFTQLLAKHGGKLPTDPAAKAAFMRELQTAMESDPERQLLLNKQIHQDLMEAAKGNTALAQAIQAAGGAGVLVPSFNAKVMLLPKNNPHYGPLGAYVPGILSRDKLKQRLLVLEEYAVEKEVYQKKAERLYQSNRDALDRLMAEYQSERDAVEKKRRSGVVIDRQFIEILHEKYKDNPDHKSNVEQMVECYIEREKCSNLEFQAQEARDAAYREWKRLLDDYDGAARVAAEVNRAVKARAKADLVDQMTQVGEGVYAREKELQEKQGSRKKLFWETHEKMRPEALAEYNRFPEERKTRQPFDSYLYNKANDEVNPIISEKYGHRVWDMDDLEEFSNRSLDRFDRGRIVELRQRHNQFKKGTPLQNSAKKPEIISETVLESKYDGYFDMFTPDPLFEWEWNKSPKRKGEAGDVKMVF